MSVSESECDSHTEMLISVENAIKNHYLLLQSAAEIQRVVLDRMWVLAQRYTILDRGASPRQNFPADASHRIEDEIRAEFYTKLGIVNSSNSKLTSSLSNLKSAFHALNGVFAEADFSCLTSLDRDDPIQPPIAYFIEMFSDFVKYFSHTQSKLNCFAILLTSHNVPSIESYKKLLEPSKEFDAHFLKSLAHCSCLQTHKKAKT